MSCQILFWETENSSRIKCSVGNTGNTMWRAGWYWRSRRKFSISPNEKQSCNICMGLDWIALLLGFAASSGSLVLRYFQIFLNIFDCVFVKFVYNANMWQNGPKGTNYFENGGPTKIMNRFENSIITNPFRIHPLGEHLAQIPILSERTCICQTRMW